MVEALPFEPGQEPIPAPNPNKAIRDYIQTDEAAEGWKNADKARELYDYQQIITSVLFARKDESQPPMPETLVAIDRLPVSVLGAFHLAPDGLGLRHKITINGMWSDRPVWELLETLVHEDVHVYINDVLGHKDTHNYHTGEFVTLMADLGFKVKPGEGYHLAPASGQFAALMNWLEVPQPAVLDAGDAGGFILPPGFKQWWEPGREPVKGRSTLTKYEAENCMLAPTICNFRAGKKDLLLGCLRDGCSGKFQAVQ